MQGVYTYQHTNTMSKYVRYCSTYGLKINSTNVQMTSVSCGNELDFNSSTAKTYTVENLYLYSNNSEGASFDLYLDGTKEYECTRSFGSVYCTSKSGSSYSYKMSSE
jgi:hypothetical protein